MSSRRRRTCGTSARVLSLGIHARTDLRKRLATSSFVTLTQERPSVRYALLRAAGAAESGYRMGPPGKAVRPTGRTCSYGWDSQLAVRAGRLGRPQSPTKGRHHKETETAAVGCSGH